MHHVQLSGNATGIHLGVHRWMGIRLDFPIGLVACSVAALSIVFKGKIDSSILTFALQNVLDTILFLSVTIRFYGDFENLMTSAKRAHTYT